MIEVLHVDSDLIVAVKPAGTEAQSAKGFAADMVSGLKKYLVINSKRTLYRSYTQAGQARFRCYGLCEDEKSGCGLEFAASKRENGENLSGSGLWKTCG